MVRILGRLGLVLVLACECDVDVSSSLIPHLRSQPFAAHHTMYLRNYKITGKSRIMGESREVLGLHKNRYTFNIKINVTRLQQSEGEGLNFMGVISKVDDDSTQPVCCMTTGGLIISSNRAFTDITGYKSTELLGKNFRTLLVNQEEAEAIVSPSSGTNLDI